jgi:hypothetical protein
LIKHRSTSFREAGLHVQTTTSKMAFTTGSIFSPYALSTAPQPATSMAFNV